MWGEKAASYISDFLKNIFFSNKIKYFTSPFSNWLLFDTVKNYSIFITTYPVLLYCTVYIKTTVKGKYSTNSCGKYSTNSCVTVKVIAKIQIDLNSGGHVLKVKTNLLKIWKKFSAILADEVEII